MAGALPEFPRFDTSPDAGDVSLRWKRWISRFKNLMVGMAITDNDRKHALFLHYAGEEVNNIYDTLPDTAPGDNENIMDKSVTALTAHFSPEENTELEVMRFRKLKQEPGEGLVDFFTRLKKPAILCGLLEKILEL